MQFSYGEKTVAVLLTSDRKLVLTDTKYRYLIGAPWQGQKRIKLCLVVADTKQEAVSQRESIKN